MTNIILSQVARKDKFSSKLFQVIINKPRLEVIVYGHWQESITRSVYLTHDCVLGL